MPKLGSNPTEMGDTGDQKSVKKDDVDHPGQAPGRAKCAKIVSVPLVL